VTSPTHDFVLSQGARRNDTQYITEHEDDGKSVPTQHGFFLMRSRLEAIWARHFESRGFKQATPGVTDPPCYFYEPAGCKKWPTYAHGHHYRIDFVLVYEVENRVIIESPERAKYGVCSRAIKWEWVSIKATENAQDLEHLKALVAFDSRHQRAFQCCGYPDQHPIIYTITWDLTSETTVVKRAVR